MSSEAEKDDSGSVPAPPIEAAALTASSEAGADNSYGAWSSWAMVCLSLPSEIFRLHTSYLIKLHPSLSFPSLPFLLSLF